MSLYHLFGQFSAQEPLPRGHEIYIFDRPFLGHLNYTLRLNHAQETKRRFLKNAYTSTLHSLPHNYLPLEKEVLKLTIPCLLTLQMLHAKIGRYWLSGFWDVNGRRTPHSNRWIGHLSDSGDLKTYRFLKQYVFKSKENSLIKLILFLIYWLILCSFTPYRNHF